jgi:hypothetical protein
MWEYEMNSSRSGCGPVTGCEHGSEPFFIVKSSELLDKLSEY